MRSRIARAAALVALIAIGAFVPARHALAQYMGGDGLGGGSEQSLGTLNTLYCQLTGCSMTGAITLGGNLKSGTSTTTNAGTGSCSSVTVSGTVLDFTVTATCTAAQTVIVTFSTGFGAAPICTMSSANTAAGAITTGTPYESAGGSTTATFTFPAVTAGKYNVHCML